MLFNAFGMKVQNLPDSIPWSLCHFELLIGTFMNNNYSFVSDTMIDLTLHLNICYSPWSVLQRQLKARIRKREKAHILHTHLLTLLKYTRITFNFFTIYHKYFELTHSISGQIFHTT
jgi:hypothetical protein